MILEDKWFPVVFSAQMHDILFQWRIVWILSDSVAEWSKARHSSCRGAIRVGSNPTAVIAFFCVLKADLRHSEALRQLRFSRSVGIKSVWSNGYDVRLTRERFPVRSWALILFYGCSGKQSGQQFQLRPKGPSRGLNPGPPAPKAGIIPLDHTAGQRRKSDTVFSGARFHNVDFPNHDTMFQSALYL